MKNKLKVIGIGEVLWDMLPDGKKLGGAPCNFVYHAQQQGAEALALSAIGNDPAGKEILEVLKDKEVSTALIQVNQSPTGTVDVKLNDQGIPEYTIHEHVAWDNISFNSQLASLISVFDIVCFGSLAQRSHTSRKTIESLLQNCDSSAYVVFDINLRQQYYSKEVILRSLELCNVLKLNEDELPVVCDLLEIQQTEEEEQIKHLIDTYSLKLVAYTKGSEGSLLVTPTNKSYIETPTVQVKDTVGAGDSFTAVMIVGFANGLDLKELHQKAVDVSAYVCTKDGAMPEIN